MADIKRIRLTRSVILNGGEHSEKGEVHDAPVHLAHRLVGEGSAEYLEPEEQPTSVNRMMAPGHADPRTTRIDAGPGPRVHGSESYGEMQKRVEGELGDDSRDDELREKGKGKGKK
jgi:hypothetical protein